MANETKQPQRPPENEEMAKKRKELFSLIHQAVPFYEDVPCYEVEDLVSLYELEQALFSCKEEEKETLKEQFSSCLASLKKKPDAPEKILLWKEGNMPSHTDYQENPGRFNHDPDFIPHLYEIPFPEGEKPKDAIVCIAGGDHGWSTILTYQTALDLTALGHQCFLLNNRVNMNPWDEYESGVDASRAVRIVRSLIKDRGYDKVAIAGFSNGGLTGENCILHYSGTQTVKDHFPYYAADELDEFYGSPDAFLCIYGPRFAGNPYDFTNVVYPPVFFAVGLDDPGVKNLYYASSELLKQGIPVEMHTFAGVPHGVAGRKVFLGKVPYPNFDLWLPLSDAFLDHHFRK